MPTFLFCLLVAWGICMCQTQAAPVNNGTGKFISLVPEGSGDGTPCGYRWFGPALLEINFNTTFQPTSIAQWVNGTAKLTAATDFISGSVEGDFNVWPYHAGSPLCDFGHGEEGCPIKKGQEVVIPFNKYLKPYYMIPGHYTANISAINDKKEIAAYVEVECTISPARPFFPNVKNLVPRFH